MVWQRRRTRILLAAVAVVGMGTAGCHPSSSGAHGTKPASGSASASASASAPPGDISGAVHPATKVDTGTGQGYFPDPYPVRSSENGSAPDGSASGGSSSLTLTGTRNQAITCQGDIESGCFQEKQLRIRVDPALKKRLAARGVRLKSSENHDISRLASGSWDMALTFHMDTEKNPEVKHWHVIMHARPASVPAHGTPTSWVADSLLVGDTTHPTKGNYDGKYFEDHGKLYLLYSKRVGNDNVLLAQPMESPEKTASGRATVLLAPGDYTSEYATSKHKNKLVESGSVVRINGKYALTYSTGSYDRPEYKAGIAWSDTFLPPAGKQYRRVTTTDTEGVWGKPGRPEVRYLIQSMEPSWPNYAAKAVTAPGAPAIASDGGHWYLVFAGYKPSDAPKESGGVFDGSHRRPFYAPLSVHVPDGASVAGSSEADLAKWVTIAASH
ncbi:family 43 glycosylhydrolase [Streptomyces sp. NPDC050560]|uniref:family 43 glycosylhydrolase n=1 Tax=Streptomyces sp. NPDC050560 TaxID=3365630 RepID=UPI0037A79223